MNLTKEAVRERFNQPLEELSKNSFKLKQETLGNEIHLRGLVEFSNFCNLNCHYCGIRMDNEHIPRYLMDAKEIRDIIKRAYDLGVRSYVLQSGEDQSSGFVKNVSTILGEIQKIGTDNSVTLSLGLYEKEIYKKWRELGANRYLLRIETSNEELFKKIHDNEQSLKERIEGLYCLKDTGYQVGTGVMIGIPSQTVDDLIDDLFFMKDFDIDMVGMGPYLEHDSAPMGKEDLMKRYGTPWNREKRLDLSLKMIAILREMMPTINIASSTALETIRPDGRILGVNAGANVVMPNFTPIHYRKNYHLYRGKTLTSDDPAVLIEKVKETFKNLGQEINISNSGHSRHYLERTGK